MYPDSPAAKKTQLMKSEAIRIVQPGGLDVLVRDEVELRDPGPGEVRISVRAAGLNRADLLQRRGLYPPPTGVPQDIPGLEYAGVVESLGDEVESLALGEHVMGLVGGGAMARHVVVHERQVIRVPDGWSSIEAAAVPEAFLTAYDALVRKAGLRAGETVLIHAAASGVGTAATQIALAIGAVPIGTIRNRSKLHRCGELGLRRGIVVGSSNEFSDDALDFTDGRGVAVLLDLVGATYFAESLRCVQRGGRIVLLGLLGGDRAEIQLDQVLMRQLTLIGSTMRGRVPEERAALAQEASSTLLPLFARGLLKPVIDQSFPMTSIGEAHRRMEENANVGKIVLEW